MSRPRLKTIAATIRVTPEVKSIWAAAAVAESRSMANLFEMALREYVERHSAASLSHAVTPAAEVLTRDNRKNSGRRRTATPLSTHLD